MKRNTRIVLASINAAAYLAMILINYLSNALPINGQDAGTVSDKYATFFTPAGLTFAIWGIIYLGLGAFIVYQIIDSFRIDEGRTSFVDRIGVWFIVSCLANMTWLFTWHYEILWLSVIIMLVLLGSLLMIYQRLNIGLEAVAHPIKYYVHLPFSLYLGWISVATIANISSFLVSLEWGGLGISQPVWAVVMVLIAIILAALMLLRRGDVFYALVIAWASFGIYTARNTQEPMSDTVKWVALVGMILILGGIGFTFFRKRAYVQ